jgi:DNA (cytosine-5)-methyltransferase 1
MQHLLGWECKGYVEWDNYCQKVIAQRQKDGFLDVAPIFGDVREFASQGYARSYTGMVDAVVGGPPCQDFSVAGKRAGAEGTRNMFPAAIDVVRIVQPRFCLFENVPGIRSYLPVVVRDLRRLGYEVRRPLQLGADDVGAPHRRKRVWIVAHASDNGLSELCPASRYEGGVTQDYE